MTANETRFLRFWRRVNELRRHFGFAELCAGAAQEAWQEAHARRFMRGLDASIVLRPAPAPIPAAGRLDVRVPINDAVQALRALGECRVVAAGTIWITIAATSQAQRKALTRAGVGWWFDQ